MPGSVADFLWNFKVYLSSPFFSLSNIFSCERGSWPLHGLMAQSYRNCKQWEQLFSCCQLVRHLLFILYNTAVTLVDLFSIYNAPWNNSKEHCNY